jgi:hypothetical protein
MQPISCGGDTILTSKQTIRRPEKPVEKVEAFAASAPTIFSSVAPREGL